jgi:hypothetical protein
VGHVKDNPKEEKRRVRNKMKNKMIGVAAVLLIALMLAGVSYALWSKTIYIYGDVYTGDVDAEVGETFSWEAYDAQGNTIPEEKKTMTVDIYRDEVDPQIFYVDIFDLYPCITIHIDFEIWNTGTVPWIVQSVTLTSTDFPGTVTFTPPDLIGTQVEPGEYVNADLEIHITNAADENSQYGFTVEILVVQWNEYVPPVGGG